MALYTPGKGISVWAKTMLREWNTTIPRTLVDPDYATHINVTVSPLGLIALYASGRGFESVLVYNSSGFLLYQQSSKTVHPVTLYSLASWSPSGGLLALLVYNEEVQGYMLTMLNSSTWRELWVWSTVAPANPP